MLDQEMRSRIVDLAARMGALPEDLPVLGEARGDGTPYCVRGPDGWHLTRRERDRVLSDRISGDADEFAFWIAETIAERIAWRRSPPESTDFPRHFWRAHYDALATVDRDWAQIWLTTTRAQMVDAGAGDDVLAALPSGR